MKFLLISCLRILVVILISIFSFTSNVNAEEQNAFFAGGCFWCLEHDFEDIEGVLSVDSGYAGGELINPTYSNHEGHQEAIRIKFDPNLISYEKLLRGFWRNIDPLDGDGQFCDRGKSYIPVIFSNNDNQQNFAEMSIDNAATELGLMNRDLKVIVERNNKFWLAEDYHQDFAKKNSLKYNFYRYSCGRDQRLNDVWGENARETTPWKTSYINK